MPLQDECLDAEATDKADTELTQPPDGEKEVGHESREEVCHWMFIEFCLYSRFIDVHL